MFPDRFFAAGSPSYRPDIDGLRAVAVLSVVAFHAFPVWLPGGFVGVDIFFVISGYLISGHIFASLEKNTFSIADFYARRVRRIFPALVAVLAACLAFAWIALLPGEYEQLGLHTATGAGFVANLQLWSESGYFDTATALKPLLHLWSLGIEEQFYLVWPLIAYLLWRMGWANVWTLTLIASVSFSLNTAYFQIDPTQAFYSPATRMWELLAGAALAQFERQGGEFSTNERSVLSTIGAVLLSAAFYLINKQSAFPGFWAALPVAGAVMMIAAGPSAPVNRWLSLKPVVAIGLISYPAYLWHWPLLSFAHIIADDMPSRSVRIVIVITTFFLAAATYLFIERPLRFGRLKSAAVAGPVTAMLLIGLSGYAISYHRGFPDRASIVNMKEANEQFGTSLWRFTRNAACDRRYPFKEAENLSFYFCITNADRPPDILLLGSSFANHHYPGIVGQAAFQNHTVLSIGTCVPVEIPPVPGPIIHRAPCEAAARYRQQEMIKRIVEQSPNLKLAILDGILPDAIDQDTINGVRSWVSFLQRKNIKVVIFTPHYWRPGFIKGCFARPFKTTPISCDIDPAEIESIRDKFRPLVEAIRQTNPATRFYDQNEIYCSPAGCSLISEGKPLIRDDTGHYSEFASSKVASNFVKWARINAPELLPDSKSQ